jgi:hypothetical protein
MSLSPAVTYTPRIAHQRFRTLSKTKTQLTSGSTRILPLRLGRQSIDTAGLLFVSKSGKPLAEIHSIPPTDTINWAIQAPITLKMTRILTHDSHVLFLRDGINAKEKALC